MTVDATGAAGRAEIEDALRRLLSWPEIAKNRNSALFLRFVVEETLAGRGDQLKAYTIATLALNRSDAFDAQDNSIVRVQATRLRQLLQTYYDGPGAGDPVQIVLPLRTYRPTFVRTEVPVPQTGHPAAPETDRPVTRAFKTFGKPFGLSQRGFGFAAGVLAILAVALVAWLANGLVRSSIEANADENVLRPILAVQDLDGTGAAHPAAAHIQQLLASIENGLSAFDNIIVRQSPDDGQKSAPARYLLTAHETPDKEPLFDLSFRLTHRPSGEIIWSHTFSRVDMDDSAKRDVISRAVIVAVGDVYGAITADVLKRAVTLDHGPRGYRCLLSAFDYLKARESAKRAAARSCLDDLIAADPDNARALSMQAIILVRGYLDALPDSHGVADVQRALQLARRAFDCEPNRAREQFALFFTRFYDKRFDDAFLAARKALATNPNSSIITASIGAAYISRGAYAEGQALLQPLVEMDSNAPSAFLSFAALASYMRDDQQTVQRLVMGHAHQGNPFGTVMLILACHRNHDTGCILEASQELRRDHPGFASDVAASLDRYALSDEIRRRILTDLDAAGYFSNAQN